MEQRPKVVRDIFFIFVVLHKMLRTQEGGADKAPTPGNNVIARPTEQVSYVPNDNCWNLLRKAKHQQELLKDYFNHVGALVRQEDRIRYV